MLLAAAAVLAAGTACAAEPSGQARGGLQSDVVLTEDSPLSASSELLRRLLSPLALAQTQRNLARSGKQLSEQSVDPAKERFVIYVPSGAPGPAGYALLVFVPPWEDARLPSGWAPVLDRYGVIFVSPARAGNTENVLGRRVPLALMAEANITERYPVDPRRVYIGGFSGGARVALRVALGYPDVFSGALLNAGSDPIGGTTDPIPPRELFLRFQDSTHLVYFSGENDPAVGMDGSSVHSMRSLCVTAVDAQVTRSVADAVGGGHQVAAGAALAKALSTLMEPAVREAGELSSCRAVLDRELHEKLEQAESSILSGKGAEARKLLLQIDARFGGLAAPASLELAQRCDCGVFSP